MFSPTPDPAKLEALRANPNAASGYRTWLDSFVVPMLKRVGLTVNVRRTGEKYVITVKLPAGAQ